MLLPKPTPADIKEYIKFPSSTYPGKLDEKTALRHLTTKWRRGNLEALWDRADASYAVDRQVIIDLIELLLEE
jgi:hypothetical protein